MPFKKRLNRPQTIINIVEASDMKIKECNPTEYALKGINISELIDNDFLKLIREEFPTIKFQYLLMAITEESENGKEGIINNFAIGHKTRENEDEEILSIGSRKADDTEKLLNVMKKYVLEKEKGC